MKPHEHVIPEIARERERQMAVEGWTPQHDDAHACGELAMAAACYVLGKTNVTGQVETAIGFGGMMRATVSFALWPFEMKWWKPKARRENLVRAAALIVAEIERLDRAAAKGGAA